MDAEGISLGWRCESTQIAVQLGLRKKKKEGYNTCPFDIMISNYIGMCECLKDDFRYFCNPYHLTLKQAPKMIKHLGPNQKENELWIYNSYYNFAFNHESPGHGNLYIEEHWDNGINHFLENNFKNFITRYNVRIDNFNKYLKNSDTINFVLLRYNSIPYELIKILNDKYPNLKYTIYSLINYSPATMDMLVNKSVYGAKQFDLDYLEYMNMGKYSNEINRYNEPLLNVLNLSIRNIEFITYDNH